MTLNLDLHSDTPQAYINPFNSACIIIIFKDNQLQMAGMKSENQSNSVTPFADAPPSYDNNAATFISRPSQLPSNVGRGKLV